MKRHKALIPLSSHHQNALVLAMRLKRAGKEKHDPRDLVEDFLKFWQTGGIQHFRDEEDILLPTFARFAEPWRPEIQKMLRQHIQIRKTADELKMLSEREEAPSEEILRQLGETLDDHVRLEENEIFPMVEKAVPEEELGRVLERLQHE